MVFATIRARCGMIVCTGLVALFQSFFDGFWQVFMNAEMTGQHGEDFRTKVGDAFAHAEEEGNDVLVF